MRQNPEQMCLYAWGSVILMTGPYSRTQFGKKAQEDGFDPAAARITFDVMKESGEIIPFGKQGQYIDADVVELQDNPSSKEEVTRMLRSPPPSWKALYKRYGLPSKPSPKQVVEKILEYTPSGREYGPRGEAAHTPPASVRKAALKGLRLSHAHNYTSTSGIGLARAVQLALYPKVWDRSVERMEAYFTRHRSDKKGRNFGNDTTPSRGYMAWLNWGGDPGYRWAQKKEVKLRSNGYKTVIPGPIAMSTPSGPRVLYRNPQIRLVPKEEVRMVGFSKTKTRKVEPEIPTLLSFIEEMAGEPLLFPTPIVPLSQEEIAYGRSIVDLGHPCGAGHGMYNEETFEVKINSSMSPLNLVANVLHENLHHAFPHRHEVWVDKHTAKGMEKLYGIPSRGRPYANGPKC